MQVSSSLSDDGVIHLEEFKEVMFGNASVQNLFADRVFELFDIEHNGVIGFGDFIRSLSIFHPNAPVQQKIDFAYHLYDLHEVRAHILHPLLVGVLFLEAQHWWNFPFAASQSPIDHCRS